MTNNEETGVCGRCIFTPQQRQLIEKTLSTPKRYTEICRLLGIKSKGGFEAFLRQCDFNAIPIYQIDGKQTFYALLQK